MKKEFQAQQAAALRPAELDHGDGAWRALHTLHVRLYVDTTVAKKVGVRTDFEDRLARVNQVLEPALHLRLQLESVRDLPAQQQGADTGVLLTALEQLDDAKDVDFVVGLVGASPVVTLSFHDLGRARVLGKHIVVRTMDDAAELRAIAEFDTLSAEERSRLYQQRKRHKETAILLHELGHTLGALHTRDPLDLMHPEYDNHMQGFAQPNLDLMAYVVDERTADETQRDPELLVQRITNYLKHSDFQGWVEEERQSYLTELEAAATHRKAAASAGAASQAQPPAPPSEDLSALSEADRARYLGIDKAWDEQRWKDVSDAITSLAQAYPDSFAVQQKACRVGMQLGLSYRSLKPFCDRMTALSMQAH
jgi:hypothetical protein